MEIDSVTTGKFPDSKIHWANMGPIWGQQNPGGPYVGPMNFAIWVHCNASLQNNFFISVGIGTGRYKYNIISLMSQIDDSRHSMRTIYKLSLIARFMGPTWGRSGANRAQVGPIFAPWTLISVMLCKLHVWHIFLYIYVNWAILLLYEICLFEHQRLSKHRNVAYIFWETWDLPLGKVGYFNNVAG